jgi:hypothetical protein
MWTGKLRAAGLATSLALATLALASCGSGGGDSTTVALPPPVSPDTAGHLAKLSDRVATDLDAGDTCNAAHAADDLQAAIEDADLPASMRSSVDAAAGRLVDQVNCPPPPPAPEPEQKKKKKKHDEGQDEHKPEEGGDQGHVPPGHAKHGGFVPPGQAKLKGEIQ